DVIYAIKGHALYLNLDRRDKMTQALYAVDDLGGLVTALAEVSPTLNNPEADVHFSEERLPAKSVAEGARRAHTVAEAAALGGAGLGPGRTSPGPRRGLVIRRRGPGHAGGGQALPAGTAAHGQ